MPVRQPPARPQRSPSQPSPSTDNLLVVPGAGEEAQVREAALNHGQIVLLPPSRLVPMEHQPRSQFDKNFIPELAANIVNLRQRGLGIMGTGYLEALNVRLPLGVIGDKGQITGTDFKFPLVRGETRYHASVLLRDKGIDYDGHHVRIPDIVVPVMVSDLSDADAQEIAFFDNDKRRQLSPLDEARTLQAIINKRNLSLRGAALFFYGDIGKRGRLENLLGLQKCDPDVLRVVDERPDSVTIARRIQTVKAPKLRKTLIEEALAGATFARIDAHVKRYLQDSREAGEETTDAVTGDSLGVVGKARGKGAVSLKTDVEAALNVATAQLDSAVDALRGGMVDRIPWKQKAKYRGQAEKLAILLGEFESLVAIKESMRRDMKNARRG